MTFWKDKRVLVTGCSGLMGGYLCKELLAQGANLLGYDTDGEGTLGRHGIAGGFPIILKSILDQGQLYSAMTSQEVVFHLAAMSGVEDARESAQNAWSINATGTIRILDTARHVSSLEAVVVASSNHVYGKQEKYPVKEDAPLNQLDMYSATKICADVMTRAYAHNYGVPTAAIRNTNCFGPFDPHKDHLIPGTILALLNGEQPTIRGKGLTKKSYLHVQDVITAYLKIAEWVATTGHIGEAWNVSDPPMSVLDVVKIVCYFLDKPYAPKILAVPNDQHDEDMDSARIRGRTGWEPQYTLREAIEDTVKAMESEYVSLSSNPR